MKKIAYIIALLLGILIFISGFNEESRLQKQNLSCFEILMSGENLDYSYFLLQEPAKNNPSDLQNGLSSLLEENQGTAFIQGYRQLPNGTKATRYFVYSSKGNKPIWVETQNGSVNLTDNQDFLITSHGSLKGSSILDFADRRLYSDHYDSYEIVPLSSDLFISSLEDPLFHWNTLGFQSQNLAKLTESLQKDPWSSQLTYLEGQKLDGDFEGFGVFRSSEMAVLILICGLSFVFLCTAMVIRKKKEVAVLKLLGKPNWWITLRLFFRQSLCSVLLFSAGFWIPYFIVVGNFRRSNQPLWQLYLASAAALVLFCCILMIFLWVVICRMKTGVSLKVKHSGGSAFSMLLMVKCLLAAVLILPFWNAAAEMIYSGQQLWVLMKNREELESLASVGYLFDGELISSLGTVLSDDFKDRTILFISSVSGIVGNEGGTNGPQEVPKYKVQYPYVETTADYILKKYPDLFQNDSIRSKEQDYYLIPQSLLNKYAADFAKMGTTEQNTIPYSVPISMLNLSYQLGDSVILSNPVIKLTAPERFFGYAFGSSHFVRMDDQITQTELNRYLEDTQRPFLWMFGKDKFETCANRLTDDLVQSLSSFVFMFVSTLAFLYAFFVLYLDDKKNLIAVKTIVGMGWLKKYGSLLMINTVIYICALILSLFLNHELIWNAVVSGVLLWALDLIVTLVLIRRFEKHKLTAVMKGDEL